MRLKNVKVGLNNVTNFEQDENNWLQQQVVK